MPMITDPWAPKDMSELVDLLGSMMLGAPFFKDKSGYFLNQGIETEFASLNAGLEAVRRRVGEESYLKLLEVSGQMRAHFEAGQDGHPEEISMGRKCIRDMEDILRAATRRKSREPGSFSASKTNKS